VADRLAGLVAMSSGDGRLDTLIRLTCGRALSLPPLPTEVDLLDAHTVGESVVAAFAEQFAIDVSGIGANQRKLLLATLGDNAFRAVTAIFIADFVPRVLAGFNALALGEPGNGGEVVWDHETDPTKALLKGFVPAIARLRVADADKRLAQQRHACRQRVVARNDALARTGSHPHGIGLDGDEFQRRDLVDVDQPARAQQPERHHRDEALSACDDLGGIAVLMHELAGLLDRGRAGIFKGGRFQAATSTMLPTDSIKAIWSQPHGRKVLRFLLWGAMRPVHTR